MQRYSCNHVISLGHLFWLFYPGCNGKKLETVAQSQELFGCTIIVNHLEIRIRKGSKCPYFGIYVCEMLKDLESMSLWITENILSIQVRI